MAFAKLAIQTIGIGSIALFLWGCEEKATEAPATAASLPPLEPVPEVTASQAPPAEIVPKPSHACPEGSTGEGTFKSPCESTGKVRMMEAKWTGKTSEKGPYFQVENKTDLEILYGQLVVYCYDKAGKQLEIPGSDDKTRPKQLCVGNIFAGPMKPKEKAVLQFSCVKKEHVPEGTAFIEAELQGVGFTGTEGKRADTYWRNKDLTPDERPKGGIKK